MAENRRDNTWLGYLPSRALVMASRHSAAKPDILPQENDLPAQAIPSKELSQNSVGLLGNPQCDLCFSAKSIVMGEGNPHATLVFVSGEPEADAKIEHGFVGNGAPLLVKMIEAMGLRREQVYLAPVVKCGACRALLEARIDAIQPKVVVALGPFAAQTLLETETPFSQLRGSFRAYRGAKLLPTFHPAHLLENPDAKRQAWADLQLVAQELGIKIPSR